tara:strand:+ start:39193 stop:39720 length:528 start_codon:yes stop_codon:yes gene_type:complete
MKTFKYIFLLSVLTACNTPHAVYDYDQQVQFNTLSTYQIFPELNSNLSQLDEQRLLSILDTEMKNVGFAQASNAPDVYLNYYATSFETPSQSNIGIGVGGTGRNVGVGVSGGIPIGGPNTQLRITFDLINVKNDALIWQAIVDSPFDMDASPEKREEQLRTVVKKALEGYPPNQK